MDSLLTRRQLNKGLLAAPLIGLPFRAYPPKAPNFRGRFGVIHFAGNQNADHTWRLSFRLGIGESNSERRGRFIWVIPSNEFLRRLQDIGFTLNRSCSPKQINVDAATLRHGPVGLALLLESQFTADDHYTTYIHPSVDEWGEFHKPSPIVKKGLWIEQ